MPANQWLIWQIIDSAFPTGGFAHSSGLETGWRHGWVSDGKTLAKFVDQSIRQVQRGVLPYLLMALNHPPGFSEIDSLCDLFLNNHVANRASRAQGRAFLRAAAEVFDSSVIKHLAGRARQDGAPIHFAPVFGIICSELVIEDQTAVSMFLFMAVRGIISAAVRLGIIGPMQGQQIQKDYAAGLNEQKIPVSTVAIQTAPFQDLLHGTHDRLYSRLFQT